jgi:hypothetical protein
VNFFPRLTLFLLEGPTMKTRLLTAAVLFALAARPAAARTWKQAYSLEGVSTVRVENVNGNVTVRAWDRPYVRVTADQSGSMRALENTRIRVRLEGDLIRIETETIHKHHFFFFVFHTPDLAHVDYELLLPSATKVHLSTVNGSVRAEGRAGPSVLDCVNGRIEVPDGRSEIRANSVNGRIWVHYSGRFADSRLKTVNGSIDAEVPEDSSIRYRMESLNGHLEAGGEEASRSHVIGRELSGEWNGGHNTFEAETVNGSIHLTRYKP